MTAFGEYEPTKMEVDAFRHVYAGEPGTTGYDPRWMEELCDYASEQTKAQFESVRVRPD